VKGIFRRLKDRRGETLVEALASILIFTFSSILLLSMISSAARINATAKEADGKWAEQLNAAESGGDSEMTTARVTLHVNGSVLSSWEVYVAQQKGEPTALYAYYRTK